MINHHSHRNNELADRWKLAFYKHTKSKSSREFCYTIALEQSIDRSSREITWLWASLFHMPSEIHYQPEMEK